MVSDIMKYVRITNGLNDKGYLATVEEYENTLKDFISDTDKYVSAYYYNDEQLKQFEATGSIRGITDVKTNKLVFDFDDKQNLELARRDTVTVIERLKGNSVPAKDIEIYFSGMKGFTVGVKLNRMITPKQHEKLALYWFGKGLTTIDPSIYNPSRIIRIPNSRHQATGLYKIKLTEQELKDLSIDAIKLKAKTPGSVAMTAPVSLEDRLFKEDQPKKKDAVVLSTLEEAMKFKPRHWKDYKWALVNAIGIESGERHNAMMVIAATCKGYGYTREITEGFLQSFDDKYSETTKSENKPEEIEQTLNSVFDDSWSGGQYSYENNVWLRKYCERIGIDVKPDKRNVLKIDDLFTTFESFAQDFEKNILKTGIKEVDDNVLFLTSTHNGILGCPGSGKTSWMIQWLKHLSSKKIKSFFYSLDMAEEMICSKLIQSVTGYSFEKAVQLLRKNSSEYETVKKLIKQEFEHVKFIFTSGTTTATIRRDIERFEEDTGEKVKLLVVDYLECIQGPYSDQTANSGAISQEMKDLARDLKVCSVMLLQTQKHTGGGDVSEPLLSMRNIKGSSAIEQSSSVILTIWREGYHPKFSYQDKFMSVASVKNRFGGLWAEDFMWDGLKGKIVSMASETQRQEIKQLREDKKAAKKAEKEESGWT